MSEQNGAAVGEYVERPDAMPKRRKRKSSDFPYDSVLATLEQGGAYRFTVTGRKPQRAIASMKSEFKRRGFQMQGLIEEDGVTIQAWIAKTINPGETKTRKKKAAS